LERLKLEKCSSRSTAGVVVPVPGGGELNSNSNEGFVGTKIKILKREKPIGKMKEMSCFVLFGAWRRLVVFK